MAVLIECLNVIVPVEVLERKFPGGAKTYAAQRPNATYVSDDFLTRIGFMTPRDTQLFAGALAVLGLTHLDERGYAVDFVVVDQFRGPTTPCDWLGFAEQPHLYAAAAWLKSAGEPGGVHCPSWWKPDPGRVQFVGDVEFQNFKFVGCRDGLDVFEDGSGEKRYIGRPFAEGEVPFADLRANAR